MDARKHQSGSVVAGYIIEHERQCCVSYVNIDLWCHSLNPCSDISKVDKNNLSIIKQNMELKD